MQTRMIRCGFVILSSAAFYCLATSSQATQEASNKLFRDVPRSNHAYKTIEKLHAVLPFRKSICFPSSHGVKYDQAHIKFTRYEFAVIIQRALAILEAKQRKPGFTASQRDLLNEVHQLAREFHAELVLIR